MADITDQIIEKMFSISRLIHNSGVFDENTADITLLQLQVIMFIGKKENSTMSDIATFFSTSLPTATSIIDKLVRGELLHREQDEKDRRIVRIALTEKGKKIFEQAKQKRSERANKFLSYLSDKEKVNLLEIFSSLQKRLEVKNG